MQVEIFKWTGGGLQLVSSPLSGSTRLVSSLSVIKNQFMLAGSTRKGLCFLQVVEASGTLKLLARDFGVSDSAAVEFLLEGQTLSFLQADTHGNVSVFRYERAGNARYEVPGLRAVPAGSFHLGHVVRTVRH